MSIEQRSLTGYDSKNNIQLGTLKDQQIQRQAKQVLDDRLQYSDDDNLTCWQSIKQSMNRFCDTVIDYLECDRVYIVEGPDAIQLTNYRKRFMENFQQSYSERQTTFAYSFQDVLRERRRQEENKQKNWYKELIRFICCEGGNEMEEIDQKYQADSEYEKIVAKRSGKKRLIEERLQTVDQNEEREQQREDIYEKEQQISLKKIQKVNAAQITSETAQKWNQKPAGQNLQGDSINSPQTSAQNSQGYSANSHKLSAQNKQVSSMNSAKLSTNQQISSANRPQLSAQNPSFSSANSPKTSIQNPQASSVNVIQTSSQNPQKTSVNSPKKPTQNPQMTSLNNPKIVSQNSPISQANNLKKSSQNPEVTLAHSIPATETSSQIPKAFDAKTPNIQVSQTAKVSSSNSPHTQLSPQSQPLSQQLQVKQNPILAQNIFANTYLQQQDQYLGLASQSSTKQPKDVQRTLISSVSVNNHEKRNTTQIPKSNDEDTMQQIQNSRKNIMPVRVFAQTKSLQVRQVKYQQDKNKIFPQTESLVFDTDDINNAELAANKKHSARNITVNQKESVGNEEEDQLKLKRKRKNRQKDEPIAVVRQERIRPVGNDGGAVGTDVTDGAFEEGIGNQDYKENMDSALKVPTNTGYYENSYLSQVEYRNKRIEQTSKPYGENDIHKTQSQKLMKMNNQYPTPTVSGQHREQPLRIQQTSISNSKGDISLQSSQQSYPTQGQQIPNQTTLYPQRTSRRRLHLQDTSKMLPNGNNMKNISSSKPQDDIQLLVEDGQNNIIEVPKQQSQPKQRNYRSQLKMDRRIPQSSDNLDLDQYQQQNGQNYSPSKQTTNLVQQTDTPIIQDGQRSPTKASNQSRQISQVPSLESKKPTILPYKGSINNLSHSYLLENFQHQNQPSIDTQQENFPTISLQPKTNHKTHKDKNYMVMRTLEEDTNMMIEQQSKKADLAYNINTISVDADRSDNVNPSENVRTVNLQALNKKKNKRVRKRQQVEYNQDIIFQQDQDGSPHITQTITINHPQQSTQKDSSAIVLKQIRKTQKKKKPKQRKLLEEEQINQVFDIEYI